MAVEDMEKSATPIVDASNINNGDVDDEVEEGEIVGDEASAAAAISSRVSAADETHPLEHSWTFWFDNPTGKARQSTWGNSIRPVYTFSTIEQFWSLFNNIRHPSKLGLRTDLYCFKHKIEPKWEDPVCANGGKWTVSFPKGKSDTPFLYTLLAMIGEQFDHGAEVCGAVVNIRQKEDRISVWTKNALNESAQVSIGRQWKEFLDYKDTMGFIIHEDAKTFDRNAKNRYSL